MNEEAEKIDIKTKQMLEKNRLARYCGTITCIALIFFAVRSLIMDGINPLDGVRLVLAVLDIILFQVCYISFGEQYRYKFAITLSMVVMFLLNI